MKSNSADRQSVYRILDANINRASEGLRTLEEHCRFVSEDPELSLALKQTRHDLMTLIGRFDRIELLKNRDVSGDIGCSIKTESETRRESVESVIAAAVQRVQQSLRCLEEYGKVIDPSIAASLEQLRYRAYEVFAKVELSTTRKSLWPKQGRLYALIDCQLPFQEFIERACKISKAGVDIIQIRDKQRDARLILDYTRALSEHLDAKRTRIIVNDRVDIASLAGDGVHLGQEDLPIGEARTMLPASRLIGISTHTIEQAIAAEIAGADYIGCGPTFASQTKSFESFAGLDFLKQVSETVSIPAFAIGGINLDRLDEVLATGIRRVAVGYAIWHAPDAAATASQFAERLLDLPKNPMRPQHPTAADGTQLLN